MIEAKALLQRLRRHDQFFSCDLSQKGVREILERHGWSLRRVNGSHHIYGKAGSVVRISVPIHGNQTLKAGLQAHLAKMAGLADQDFE